MPDYFLPITVRLYEAPSPKPQNPVSAPVRAFVPLLQAEWHPYTPEGVKRGVDPFVRDCGRERFSSPKAEVSGQTEAPGGWAERPASR